LAVSVAHADNPPLRHTATLPSGAGAALLDPETATNVASYAVNAGQLAGYDENGLELQDPADLLPLTVQSLLIRTATGDAILLDGNGLFGIRVQVGGFSFLNAQGEPTGEVTSWADALNKVDWAAVTNQPPRQALLGTQIENGLIQPEHLGFSVTTAAGGEGAVQYSASGELAGTSNVFVQAEARLGVRVQTRNVQRVYRSEEATDENLIYSLRRGYKTAEITFYKDGEPTARLDGNGVLQVRRVETEELAIGAQSAANAWYIPETGDLDMGNFTAP